MIMFEDNTATIQIIKTGKNPTMRHLLRHQGINIRVLHETFYPRHSVPQAVYHFGAAEG